MFARPVKNFPTYRRSNVVHIQIAYQWFVSRVRYRALGQKCKNGGMLVKAAIQIPHERPIVPPTNGALPRRDPDDRGSIHHQRRPRNDVTKNRFLLMLRAAPSPDTRYLSKWRVLPKECLSFTQFHGTNVRTQPYVSGARSAHGELRKTYNILG